MPKFATRDALIILNAQNDAFEPKDGETLCPNQDFRHRLAKVVPTLRDSVDVVWIKTELNIPGDATSDARYEQDIKPKHEAQSPKFPSFPRSSPGKSNQRTDLSSSPSSSARAELQSASIRARNDARHTFTESLDMADYIEDFLHKPRKGCSSHPLFMPGTRGVQLSPDMLILVREHDSILTANNYSAFENTSLLMSLRMRLVTHIYLTGCLGNVSVYATAADAAKHGFEVTVIEDCVGYRDISKQAETMRKMVDFLGVHITDSQDIIKAVHDSGIRDGSDEGIEEHDSAAQLHNSSHRSLHSRQDKAILMPSVGSSSPQASDHYGPMPMEGVETEKSLRKAKKAAQVLLGPKDTVGEGDSRIIYQVLTPVLADTAFGRLMAEVEWQIMRHRNGEVPRRVAVQGESATNGAVPLYRHPADESPPLLNFTPTVRKICNELQTLLEQPFNHCLIQLYRDGQDNISEHSDKTLDIVRGSSVVNLSIGAQRTMTLRSKKDASLKHEHGEPGLPRSIQRIPMPHNSVFVLGWNTNAKWLHGVRPDKRLLQDKTQEELAFEGQRISLTFRNIGTYTNAIRTKIWGQGAKSKIESSAGDIITAVNSPEMAKMLYAFGDENHLSDFNWDKNYGQGFDVLNLLIVDTPTTTLHLCNDEIANLRVKMAILQNHVPYKFTKAPPPAKVTGIDSTARVHSTSIFKLSQDENPVFHDCDSDRTEITGDIAILVYIFRFYPAEVDPDFTRQEEHKMQQLSYIRLTSANELLFLWQELQGLPLTSSTSATHGIHRFGNDESLTSSSTTPKAKAKEAFLMAMRVWEDIAGESTYISGEILTISDCIFWPVINEVVRKWSLWSERKHPNLASYWKRVGALPTTRRAMAEKGDEVPAGHFLPRKPS